jgi:lysophospholipase L1-like esterase
VAVAAVAAAVTTVRRTVTQLRSLREAGAAVPALRHEARLPGRGEPLRLVVIGDSAAAGHGLPDADAGLARQVARRLNTRTGQPVRVSSRAVDGATTDQVREQQLAEVPADADVVLVGVGVNDAVRRRSSRRVRAATERLLSGVGLAAPVADVVLMTCPDLGSAPGLPPALRSVVRISCRRVAAAQREVAADLGVAIAGADGNLPAWAFGPDGFHPGPRGVAILADRVDAALHG